MYLTIKRIYLVLILFAFSLVSFAQKTIQGTIKDTSGEPMIGVSVAHGNTGTVTDINGNYTLNNVKPGTVLKFTYVGYLTQQITLGNQTTLNVVMKADDQTLDELVVVGYGVVKNRTLRVLSVASIPKNS